MTRSSVGRLNVAVLVLAALGASATVAGIFEMIEIKKVPVQRLAQNIERQLQQKPDDIQLRLNLARLYAMAYAQKVTEFDARDKGGELQAWFGYQVPHMPGPVRQARSRDAQQRAEADLARAVQTYADVISRAPDNAVARLGYAWALEQSGQKDQAIGEYRRVVELAWPNERREPAFWVDPATTEAAERLQALLDPIKDAREIASLEAKKTELNSKGRMITPIAISLDPHDAGAPVALDARVLFDADGSGVPRRWSWIERDAAWLVYDADGAGRITSALQWFGNVTFWLFWENGYDALRALDDDGDRQLTGSELRHLALWHDANQNGFSEPGEVRPLSAHGIVAISCEHVRGDGSILAAESRAGVTFADGRTRPTYDVILRAAGTGTTLSAPVN